MELKKQYNLQDIAEFFELDEKDLPNFTPDLMYDQAVEMLNEFRRKLKKAYNKVALKYHPDRPGGGDSERMQIINLLWNEVKKIHIIKGQKQPPVIVYHSTSSGTWGQSRDETWFAL